jgi:hypothetical protein
MFFTILSNLNECSGHFIFLTNVIQILNQVKTKSISTTKKMTDRPILMLSPSHVPKVPSPQSRFHFPLYPSLTHLWLIIDRHNKVKEKESFRFRSAHTLSLHRKTRPEFIDPNLISGNGIDTGSGSRIHSQILAQIIHQRSIQIARPHCSSF